MSLTTKRNRVREAEQALANARRELAEAEQQRRQQMPKPGEDFLIEATFPGGRRYHYLGMRTPQGDFYVTGREGKLTWDEVLHRIEGRATYEVYPLTILGL